MSEAYAPRKDRRRPPEPSPAGRFIVILAVTFSSIVVVYVLSVTVVLPRLQITRVVVHADFEMDRGQLLDLAGLGERTYFFEIDTAEIQDRLESFPPIRSAAVSREFPNAVVLGLDRRRPLLLALMQGDEGTTPMLIDETGTIFQTGDGATGYDVPVLSGVSFQGRVIGSTLPNSMTVLLDSIYTLRVAAPELFGVISEIRVEAHRAGDFDVLLYFQGFGVPVRVGSTIDQETCTYALMVLDVLEKQEVAPSVRELDFRSGEIVYRMKEVQNADE
ncbi:MAG: FtsQ-type POTRA domain-containing protein [Spirochaeta sp.]|nr:FtsQ-type POTRA domain-containing protein [Spirochaeta sp.]